MLRNPRLILLFILIVAPISPARGDETLSDLAQRFTTPGGGSAPIVESESQPLGPASDAAAKLATARNATPVISSGSWIMDTLTALGVVLGLILAARWAYHRFARHAPSARTSPIVEVLARTCLAPRNHVLLLRIGSRILVVSESAGGCRTLCDIDDPEEVASLIGAVAATRDNSVTKSFTRLFQSFNGQYEQRRDELEGGDDEEHTLDRARDSISSLVSRVRLLGGRGGAA